jgi:hypothetical protein
LPVLKHDKVPTEFSSKPFSTFIPSLPKQKKFVHNVRNDDCSCLYKLCWTWHQFPVNSNVWRLVRRIKWNGFEASTFFLFWFLETKIDSGVFFSGLRTTYGGILCLLFYLWSSKFSGSGELVNSCCCGGNCLFYQMVILYSWYLLAIMDRVEREGGGLTLQFLMVYIYIQSMHDLYVYRRKGFCRPSIKMFFFHTHSIPIVFFILGVCVYIYICILDSHCAWVCCWSSKYSLISSFSVYACCLDYKLACIAVDYICF